MAQRQPGAGRERFELERHGGLEAIVGGNPLPHHAARRFELQHLAICSAAPARHRHAVQSEGLAHAGLEIIAHEPGREMFPVGQRRPHLFNRMGEDLLNHEVEFGQRAH